MDDPPASKPKHPTKQVPTKNVQRSALAQRPEQPTLLRCPCAVCKLGLKQPQSALQDHMKLVDCTSCGSKELVEEEGFIVCVYCQSRYVPQFVADLMASVPAAYRQRLSGLQAEVRA